MHLAILTGGSRGLGLALCDRLQAEGRMVIEFSRSAPHSFSVAADLADPAGFSFAVRERLDRIDDSTVESLLVIANAGTLDATGLAGSQDWAMVDHSLAINLLSPVAFFNEVIRRFGELACPKQLISISSGAALRGIAGWSLYCTAKAGMDGFIRAVGVEQVGSATPFMAISVDPGVMDTGMQTFIRSRASSEFPEVERFRARQRAGELAAPQSIAGAVLRIAGLPHLEQGARYMAREYIG